MLFNRRDASRSDAFPCWRENGEDSQDFSSTRYNRYIESGSSFYEMTSGWEEADMGVRPAPGRKSGKIPRPIPGR